MRKSPRVDERFAAANACERGRGGGLVVGLANPGGRRRRGPEPVARALGAPLPPGHGRGHPVTPRRDPASRACGRLRPGVAPRSRHRCRGRLPPGALSLTEHAIRAGTPARGPDPEPTEPRLRRGSLLRLAARPRRGRRGVAALLRVPPGGPGERPGARGVRAPPRPTATPSSGTAREADAAFQAKRRPARHRLPGVRPPPRRPRPARPHAAGGAVLARGLRPLGRRPRPPLRRSGGPPRAHAARARRPARGDLLPDPRRRARAHARRRAPRLARAADGADAEPLHAHARGTAAASSSKVVEAETLRAVPRHPLPRREALLARGRRGAPPAARAPPRPRRRATACATSCIGMAHRGRLNVLANVVGKPLRDDLRGVPRRTPS